MAVAGLYSFARAVAMQFNSKTVFSWHTLLPQRLEVHIENPALLSGLKDSTGFRVTYSPTLRPHDLGSIVTGTLFTIPSQNTTSGLVIPAGLEEYDYVNVCPSTCTRKFFPPSGAKVLNARLHMHMHGQGGSIEVSQGIMQPSCSLRSAS
jgi:hypothetical protein